MVGTCWFIVTNDLLHPSELSGEKAGHTPTRHSHWLDSPGSTKVGLESRKTCRLVMLFWDV